MSSNNDQSDASGDSSPVTATTPASSSPPRAESETKAQELPILSSWKQRKKSQATADQIREAKASMRTVLEKVTALSNKIREESSVLGHVGRDLENRPLGKLKMAKQPKILTGGVLTPHQREALTWMYYIAQQSISGILADEMGLGKTISTIAFIARLRETDAYYGPFLIAAPLSTLSNWIAEFRKWAPSIPVVQYHGSRAERDEIFRRDIKSKLSKKRQATEEFPVVCTSYEMVLADVSKLKTIPFEIIIVDEGHRLKNADSKLYGALQQLSTPDQSRFLLTGTPLQNNMKELWSMLHFCWPTAFSSWENFQLLFDVSDVEDEASTEQFLRNEEKQEIISMMHKILQPMMLRRIKADVLKDLPPKREYVLYAPLTKEQTALYRVIADKKQDAREYLQKTLVAQLSAEKKDSASEEPRPSLELATRRNRKRKSSPCSDSTGTRSAKSSRLSTPLTSADGQIPRFRASLADADSDEDLLDDDEFEAKLLKEHEEKFGEKLASALNLVPAGDKKKAADTSRQIARKKLGMPEMQLRLVCNTPHLFYNPWDADPTLPIDERIVNASGKMRLLDRLLTALLERGHKVLIFSQFTAMLDIIHDYCTGLRGWTVFRIDGGYSIEERRMQIEQFNTDPDSRIFLLSTKAGGHGINLSSADTAILFDSDWNPSTDRQAQDRCHRIGQKRPVIIYRFATKGTIEEHMLRVAAAKQRLTKVVIKKGGIFDLNVANDKNDRSTIDNLLLKESEVYYVPESGELLSDADLDVLLDRSPEAYKRAAEGEGSTGTYEVVELEKEDEAS